MPTLSELGLQRLWSDLARRRYRHRQFVTIAYVMDLAVKIDFNAWIRHKYRKCYSEVSDADRVYFQHTRAEKILRAVKRACRAPKVLFADGRGQTAAHPDRNAARRRTVLRADASGGKRGDGEAICNRPDAAKPVPPDF